MELSSNELMWDGVPLRMLNNIPHDWEDILDTAMELCASDTTAVGAALTTSLVRRGYTKDLSAKNASSTLADKLYRIEYCINGEMFYTKDIVDRFLRIKKTKEWMKKNEHKIRVCIFPKDSAFEKQLDEDYGKD